MELAILEFEKGKKGVKLFPFFWCVFGRQLKGGVFWHLVVGLFEERAEGRKEVVIW